jgi:tetratricopeptide (TPR) repeat protein
MKFDRVEAFFRRPPVVIASLLVLAVAAFWGVNRLVNRFREQEKALARHLFASGEGALQTGQLDQAVDDFRAALSYNHDDPQYELSLARALRDTGRTDEAETYLLGLWERTPQAGDVNLALGRLYARNKSVQDAIRYYHNAIYGVWESDPAQKRREAQLELVDFLLQRNAVQQAEAELITLEPGLPRDAGLLVRVGQDFARVQDYDHALSVFQRVLHFDRENAAALAGAGDAAFHLGRYRVAQGYLQNAVHLNPKDTASSQLLQVNSLVLDSDPFARHISNRERTRRLRAAFNQAGKRLDTCAAPLAKGQTIPTIPTALAPLKVTWLEMKPKLTHLNRSEESDLSDSVMDLVSQIELQTGKEKACGSPAAFDRALLLLAQDHSGGSR